MERRKEGSSRTKLTSLSISEAVSFNADMPPFLGFGRKRVTWLAVFLLVFLGLSWNLSRSGEEENDVEEEDFADEEVSFPFSFLPSFSRLLPSFLSLVRDFR